MSEEATSVPVLDVRDLEVRFDIAGRESAAVDGISFAVAPGEVLAIVGESGSGKSVTSMAILGLLPPNARVSGRIEFNGVDLLSLGAAEIREMRGNHVAMIFQEPMTALDPVYTVGEQIAEALCAHEPMSRGAARERALELLRLVRLPDAERRIDHYPHQLSGGQLQRVVIAMAVSCDPDLLIADEPTTALDVTVQAEILDLLRDLGARLGASVLFITHDMGVVSDIADRVAVMRDGLIVEHAEARALFSDPQEEYTRHLLSSVPHLGRTQCEADDAEPVGDPVLRFDGIDITYPGRWGGADFKAVDDVSLVVGQGEVLGLVGESGSGKSTLGRCAMGLLKASRGRVSVCGEDITDLSPRRLRPLRSEFSMVFQDPASSLNPRETIGEIVSKPLRLHGSADRQGIRRSVSEMLDRVRVPGEWTERYPHELSGGQRQRIGIARALILSPRLLVADEPTSALDVSVQATVLELFRELQADLGFSCLFITHDLGVVEQLAGRVAVLRAGRLVETGSTAAVLHASKEEYTRRLVLSAPVPDPVEQEERRRAFAALAAPT
ncbi:MULTISPECIES: ABC transporter ATP-binding protein [Brevibacterium]|uniref:ABC transporter ATP-binding protein n=1 Tax=Brevibacterium salitolerans TaxID=1403566 RepID=A0ABN2X0S5_9MICO|nr:ABC transporter ATP-binding protein [Brevibacterium sp.]